jgi:adenylate cyclase
VGTKQRLGAVVDRLASVGALETDSEEERTRKGALVLFTLLVMALSVLWIGTYLALGLALSAAIPAVYEVVSLAALGAFARTKRLAPLRFVQLSLILVLPFAVQWSLGGFVASSAVMVWAFTAPMGALAWWSARRSVPWFVAFLGLTVVSWAVDGRLDPQPVPDSVRVAFFALNIGAVSLATYLVLLYFVRERERARAALDAEHRRSERLLLNILPGPIAERLKERDEVIADAFPDATVLFADIVDFTRLADRIGAEEVVAILNETFTRFDRIAEAHALEKIKTIGDAYMVAGGIPTPRPDHAEAVAAMALEMREVFEGPDGLLLRIGIDTGPVVAGVIGRRKFIYDLWGDTVNTASRMESHGLPGRIQVTDRVQQRLRTRFVLEARGRIEVKGKEPMRTWWLLGRAGPGGRLDGR